MKDKDKYRRDMKVCVRVTEREYNLVKAIADGYGYDGISGLLRELLSSLVREASSSLARKPGGACAGVDGEISSLFDKLGLDGGADFRDDVRKRK